jgi:hypothetical protein
VSKERARRRAVREAEAAKRAAAAKARAAKLTARKQRRERVNRAARSVLPWSPGQRYSRRTRSQWGTVAAVLIAVGVVVWVNTDSWGPRIAAMLAAILITPALLTLILDRSSR